MPEGEKGMNVARIAALPRWCPVETSAMYTSIVLLLRTDNAIAIAAERIRGGSAEIIVAAARSQRYLVHGRKQVRPIPWLVDLYRIPTSTWAGTENIAEFGHHTRSNATNFPPTPTKKHCC